MKTRIAVLSAMVAALCAAQVFPTGVPHGTTLPATCAVGKLFFKDDATAGQNLYQCASLNTWTQQLNSGGGGGGGDFSSNTSTSVDGEVVLFNGTAGKTGKRATGTGIAGLTSGVLAATNLSGDVTTSGGLATTLANIPSAAPMAGSLLATAITAPSTPASGKGSIYVDSTSKNVAVKDDAGVVKHGVQTDTGTANNYISAISDAGAITKSRPACETLSNSTASCSTDTTVATNIATGTLAAARLPAALANSTSINGLNIGASTGTLNVPNSSTVGTIASSSTAYQITWASGTSATVKMPTGSAVALTKATYLAAANHMIVGTWTGSVITPTTIPTSITVIVNLCDANDCSGTSYALGTLVFAPFANASEFGWEVDTQFSLLDTTHILFSTKGWLASTATSGITTKGSSSVAAGLSVTLTAATWYLVLSFKPSSEENVTDTVNLQQILVRAES